MYSYDHLDKSRKVRKVMSISNINVPAVIKQFDEITDQMMAVIDDATIDINNSIALHLENAIYNACCSHKKVINKSCKNNRKIMDSENVNLF